MIDEKEKEVTEASEVVEESATTEAVEESEAVEETASTEAVDESAVEEVEPEVERKCIDECDAS